MTHIHEWYNEQGEFQSEQGMSVEEASALELAQEPKKFYDDNNAQQKANEESSTATPVKVEVYPLKKRKPLKKKGLEHGNNKYSPAIAKVICDKIRKAMPLYVIADGLGIGRSTINLWLDKFPDFKMDFEKAKAEGIEARLDVIDKAMDHKGSPDWRAHAWILERRYKEDFGREKLQITNNTLNVNGFVSLQDLMRQSPPSSVPGQNFLKD